MPELNSTGQEGPEPPGAPGEDLAASVEAGTGSHRVIKKQMDEDLPDDADDVAIGVPRPMPTPRVAEDEAVIIDSGLADMPVFRIEQAGQEPTPLPSRVGQANRMFRLWFAVTASVLSVALGARLQALGLSVLEVLVATLLGIALSFMPLGLGTLAGKRSGQPMMVVSRATFGVVGNIVPTVLAILVRLVWGALLLAVAGQSVGTVLAPGRTNGETGYGTVPAIAGALVLLALAAVVAVFGYALVYLVQFILVIVATVLLALTVIMTWGLADVEAALAGPGGIGPGVLSGAILVFAYLGLAWATSSADLARYQRPHSSGSAGMLWATFGAGLPSLALICYGALLAASHPGQAAAFAVDPVGSLVRLLPGWSGIPLLVVATGTLLSAVILSLYSGGLAFTAAGRCITRPVGVLLAALGTGVLALAFLVSRPGLAAAFLSLPVTLGVPVAAWAGLFSAELLVRRSPFDSGSLLHRGGAYPDWRWVNVGALMVITVIGFGLAPSGPGWLAWQGYFLAPAGIDPAGELAASGIGVLVAFGLGLLTPLLLGIPAIRRQEDAGPAHR
jgi:NCS1 family nucleobase:cation symporter-1